MPINRWAKISYPLFPGRQYKVAVCFDEYFGGRIAKAL